MRVGVKGIKLGDHGRLEVLKNDTWVPQYCPFAGEDTHCGIWCPLCSDIYQESISLSEKNDAIHICQDYVLISPHKEENKDATNG